ncbi:hypothetical protein Tco_0700183, partial [Tanacetum coccineum]
MIFEGSSSSSAGKQLVNHVRLRVWIVQASGKLSEVQLAVLPFEIEVTFSSSLLSSETMIGSSVRESGVKKADLVSFKISKKSSSFTFHEMSSAPDSLFALEVVWAVFNPSPADLVLSTRTLRLDPARLASAVKSAEASCPDADSECKMKEVDQAAPAFLPWGTSLVREEYLGALKSTGTSRLQMAFMWSVKGGSSGWLGFRVDTQILESDKTFVVYQNSL